MACFSAPAVESLPSSAAARKEAQHAVSGDPRTQIAPDGLSNDWTGAVPQFAPEDFTAGEKLYERFR